MTLLAVHVFRLGINAIWEWCSCKHWLCMRGDAYGPCISLIRLEKQYKSTLNMCKIQAGLALWKAVRVHRVACTCYGSQGHVTTGHSVLEPA